MPKNLNHSSSSTHSVLPTRPTTNIVLLSVAISLFSLFSCKESYLKKDPQIGIYNRAMDGNYVSFSEDERSSKERAISEKLKDIIS